MSFCSSWFLAVRAAVHRGASHSSSKLWEKTKRPSMQPQPPHCSVWYVHAHAQPWPFELIRKNLLQKVGVGGKMVSEALQLHHRLLRFNGREGGKQQEVADEHKKGHQKIITVLLYEYYDRFLKVKNLQGLWLCLLWYFGVTAGSCPQGGAHRLHFHVDTGKTIQT